MSNSGTAERQSYAEKHFRRPQFLLVSVGSDKCTWSGSLSRGSLMSWNLMTLVPYVSYSSRLIVFLFLSYLDFVRPAGTFFEKSPLDRISKMNPRRFAPKPFPPLVVSTPRRFLPGRFPPSRFIPLVVSSP